MVSGLSFLLLCFKTRLGAIVIVKEYPQFEKCTQIPPENETAFVSENEP